MKVLYKSLGGFVDDTRNNINIRQATAEDIPSVQHMVEGNESAYFTKHLECGNTILVAAIGGIDTGYAILNWQPRYSLYKKLDIPEIQDLNTLPDYRQRGIASAVIECCETRARDKGAEYIGISVGLHSDFGAAQRLYVKKGYIPDGYGVTYDREGVNAGDRYPVDDDLCLMMVKEL